MSNDGKFVVYVDEVNGNKTVRMCNCELLVSDTCTNCSYCQNYRSNLRAMYSKWSKRQAAAGSVQISDSSSSHMNDRYLNTHEKMKVDDLNKKGACC